MTTPDRPPNPLDVPVKSLGRNLLVAPLVVVAVAAFWIAVALVAHDLGWDIAAGRG